MTDDELHATIHRILHEFQGTACPLTTIPATTWCDARDHADAIMKAVKQSRVPEAATR